MKLCLAIVVLICFVCAVSSLAAVKVSGNKLVDASGKTLSLRGVNRSGAEFSCIQGNGIWDGPVDANSISHIKSWKANIVRVPLNEDCWLGINGVPTAMGGDAYHRAINDYVNLLINNDIYVILDLHWTAPGSTKATQQEPMPNKDHSLDFWKSVANFFKSNNAIIFDLFNEPYPNGNTWDDTSAWNCWRNGNGCSGTNYPVAGMQDIVIIGEMGEDDCAHGYVDQLMNWADSNGVGYLGWTWNTWDCKTGPSLISNYDGTPTNFGIGIKNHFASF